MDAQVAYPGLEVRTFDASRPDILIFTLRWGQLSLSVTNLGATVTNLLVPDSQGAAGISHV